MRLRLTIVPTAQPAGLLVFGRWAGKAVETIFSLNLTCKGSLIFEPMHLADLRWHTFEEAYTKQF